MLMLPYPPSTNRYWRTFRGRMVRSSEAVRYKETVQQMATDSSFSLLDGCVRVCMVLHPALPKDWRRRELREKNWVLSVRRIDLDNALKVAIDALQGIAFEDDRQITSLSIALGPAVIDGGLYVEVSKDSVFSGA